MNINKLSVVIITFNEEKNIKRCLNSVADIADEIIVVDSFSIDKTEEICKEFSVRFEKRTWQGYILTKNYANQLASNELILSLDADEAVSETLKRSILEIKEQPLQNAVYSMNRLTNYCGKWIKHCGWYPDRKIRIFEKTKANWVGEKIHETLEFYNTPNVIHLKGDLLHYSYYSIQDHILQANKFTDLTAQESFEKGKKNSMCGIYFKTIWKFIRDYYFKLGFLDGYYGFIVCKISSFATFMKYSKLHELNKNNKNETK